MQISNTETALSEINKVLFPMKFLTAPVAICCYKTVQDAKLP